MSNQFFFALIPQCDHFRILEPIRQKWDPLYRFLPLHIPLTHTLSTPLSPQNILESFKDVQMFSPFALHFKGFSKRHGDLYLHLEKGESHILSIQRFLYAKELVKESHGQKNTLLEPFVAKDKSLERIREQFGKVVQGALSFKATIASIHLIEVTEGRKPSLEYTLKLNGIPS